MTRDIHVTDDQIERMVRRRSSDAYPGLARGIVEAVADREQRRAWPFGTVPRRTPRLLAAAALVATLIVGGALAGGAVRNTTDRLPPSLPPPSVGMVQSQVPTGSPPVPLVSLGPTRREVGAMPRIVVSGSLEDGWRWPETNDAEPAGIDIVRLAYTLGDNGHWRVQLREFPPPATTLDPATVIEYGVVLDAGADGVPDCLIGINNDAPRAGDFRVWVIDLRTGQRAEQVGPPYGQIVDFVHPDENKGELGPDPFLSLFFLRGRNSCHVNTRDAPAFYAWASLSVGGELQAWDYAPDNAWLVPEAN